MVCFYATVEVEELRTGSVMKNAEFNLYAEWKTGFIYS